jgi:hypothetical protein
MKLLLAVVLIAVPVNEAEMVLVPKSSAEWIVQENLRQQALIEQMDQIIGEQQKRIKTLQSNSNCV